MNGKIVTTVLKAFNTTQGGFGEGLAISHGFNLRVKKLSQGDLGA